MNLPFGAVFNGEVDRVLQIALQAMYDFPLSTPVLMRILARQLHATQLRNANAKKGIQVPPLLIVSTTGQCNLDCSECYAGGNHADKVGMNRKQVEKLLNEVEEAGCSGVLVTGGEPLLHPVWLEVLGVHDELLSLVFTNGTLFDEARVAWFGKHRHIIPLLSIEGSREATDERRGAGVWDKIGQAMAALYQNKIPFGVSIITGGHNIESVTSQHFIHTMMKLGCRVFAYSEYVPMDGANSMDVLSEAQKQWLDAYCRLQPAQQGALFVTFPGNEELFAGCAAAGRGFVHISASGAMEPCPFAPYSDTNVCDSSFLEALQSPLLAVVRDNSSLLHKGEGGCPLRVKKDLVQQWMQK